MKFIVSSSELSTRLQTLGRVINSKNSIPVLGNFWFHIEGKSLTITAAETEITLSTVMTLTEADADADFLLSARTIQDAIKEIPDQPLTFYVNVEQCRVTIEYQNGKYELTCDKADEFPRTKALEGDIHTVVVASEKLYAGVNRALFATAEDQLRPQLNGVYFDLTPESLVIVASDGLKLACGRILNVRDDNAASFILPKKPANAFKPVLARDGGDTTVSFTDRNAVFTTEDYTMNCRLIEGRFPNYSSVIPKDNPNRITVNRPALISALRRVLVMSSLASTLVKLQIAPNRLTISAQNIDYAMGGEEWIICDYNGMNMSIGFKGATLLELLGNIESEEVTFCLANDGSRAGVIVPTQQPENEDVLMMLMPMMLNE